MTERKGSRKAMLLQLCSKDRQKPQHLGAFQKCGISGPRDLLDQNLHFRETPSDLGVPVSLKNPGLRCQLGFWLS